MLKSIEHKSHVIWSLNKRGSVGEHDDDSQSHFGQKLSFQLDDRWATGAVDCGRR